MVPRFHEDVASLGNGQDAQSEDEYEEHEEARREPDWMTHR